MGYPYFWKHPYTPRLEATSGTIVFTMQRCAKPLFEASGWLVLTHSRLLRANLDTTRYINNHGHNITYTSGDFDPSPGNVKPYVFHGFSGQWERQTKWQTICKSKENHIPIKIHPDGQRPPTCLRRLWCPVQSSVCLFVPDQKGKQKDAVVVGLSPCPVTVTTRIITCLVGNPYKPSFATVTGKGDNPRYYCQVS